MDLFGFNLEFPSKTDSFGDKSFYDIESNDLKEFWESELDTGIGDALKVDDDWSPAEGFLEVKPQVVLHDRLMSDAMLTGTAPIKAEHSYCTRLLNSDDESSDDSIIALHNLADELEEECFPVIPLKMEPDDDEDDDDSNGNKRCRTESPIIVIKEEPMSEEESLPSSRPTSPQQTASSIISCRVRASSDKKNMKTMKQDSRNVIFARNGVQQTRVLMPHMNIKVDSSNGSGFSLPPTPPSSTSSDSETGNVSPERSSPSRKLFLSIPQPTARQPIQTPLISSQPKGSTGTLTLTEEEKRTLIAEGYPIPTKLPLSKAEEKSLKKIRRKIKNKISAQESRRKKKEYMDALERKVEMLSSQNSEYRKKISNLEDANSSLLSQLQKLQQIVGGIQTLPNVNFAFKPNTVAKK